MRNVDLVLARMVVGLAGVVLLIFAWSAGKMAGRRQYASEVTVEGRELWLSCGRSTFRELLPVDLTAEQAEVLAMVNRMREQGWATSPRALSDEEIKAIDRALAPKEREERIEVGGRRFACKASGACREEARPLGLRALCVGRDGSTWWVDGREPCEDEGGKLAQEY